MEETNKISNKENSKTLMVGKTDLDLTIMVVVNNSSLLTKIMVPDSIITTILVAISTIEINKAKDKGITLDNNNKREH